MTAQEIRTLSDYFTTDNELGTIYYEIVKCILRDELYLRVSYLKDTQIETLKQNGFTITEKTGTFGKHHVITWEVRSA